MAFDEQGQADTAERKVEICGRAYDLLDRARPGSPPRTSSSTRTCSPSPPASRSTTGTRKAFIEALPLIKRALPGRAHQRRHLQPVVLVPRQRRRPRGDALGVPLPRDPRRAGHGHRQRRPARRLRGHPGRPARAASRTCIFDRRPDATDGWSRSPRRCSGEGDAARASTCPGARRPVERAARARARARHRRLHRGGHRGGAAAADAAARRDRGPADGRHEGRRRPVRRRARCSCRRWSRAPA